MSNGGRKKIHLDYRVLNSTGERVPVERNRNRVEAVINTTMSCEDEGDSSAALLQAEEGCKEALVDFFEENLLTDAYDLDEIDSYVTEVKELRTEYKRLHRQLKVCIPEYDRKMKPEYDAQCQKMSEYIMAAKAQKRS